MIPTAASDHFNKQLPLLTSATTFKLKLSTESLSPEQCLINPRYYSNQAKLL